MDPRSQKLETLRPSIKRAKTAPQSSAEETFQNKTLRPIIKFQHPLLMAIVKQHFEKRKQALHVLSKKKQIAFINSSFDKDQALKQQIKGTVQGFFTLEEYTFYLKNESSLHKRILQICKERVLSHLDQIS